MHLGRIVGIRGPPGPPGPPLGLIPAAPVSVVIIVIAIIDPFTGVPFSDVPLPELPLSAVAPLFPGVFSVDTLTFSLPVKVTLSNSVGGWGFFVTIPK